MSANKYNKLPIKKIVLSFLFMIYDAYRIAVAAREQVATPAIEAYLSKRLLGIALFQPANNIFSISVWWEHRIKDLPNNAFHGNDR